MMKQRTGISDTDPETERIMIELARAMPDWKKIEQVFSMIETTRALARAGLRDRYPEASEEELKKRLAALVLDRETVMKVYGWDPEKEGY
ncbi:MAG TPA: hypothetical protein VJZ26_11955 [Blastocatellia bacterium]|nr:hypothetical protein [Blastocatellia bacterium]